MAQYLRIGDTLIRPELVLYATPLRGERRVEIGLHWGRVIRLDGDDAKKALRWLRELPDGPFQREEGEW